MRLLPEWSLRIICRLLGHPVVQSGTLGMVFPVCRRCGKLNYTWRVAR